MKYQLKNFISLTKVILWLLVFSNASFAQHAKYVFYFIGDGMGVAHVAAAEDYLKSTNDKNDSNGLSFTKFPVSGLATTFAEDRFITGSAAAGTALATGQ